MKLKNYPRPESVYICSAYDELCLSSFIEENKMEVYTSWICSSLETCFNYEYNISTDGLVRRKDAHINIVHKKRIERLQTVKSFLKNGPNEKIRRLDPTAKKFHGHLIRSCR